MMIQNKMKTIIKFVVFALIVLLCIGSSCYYYINQPIDSKEIMCYKGKLIHRIGDDGTVYVKVKNVSCEVDRGMIIIEEKS